MDKIIMVSEIDDISLQEIINLTDKDTLQQISKSQTLRQMFLEELSIEHQVDYEKLEEIFNFCYPSRLKFKSSPTTPPSITSYKAIPFKLKTQEVQMRELLLELLNHQPQGVSKTKFLKSIRRDNLKGRKLFDRIVLEEIKENNIFKLQSKYFLKTSLVFRESNFHRQVYDIIYIGTSVRLTSAVSH